MNKKAFTILFFFLSLVGINSFAQGKAIPAEQGWYTGTYYTPVYCDGVMVDYLEGGSIRIHMVWRWVPGVSYMEIDQIKGKVTSETGEVFKISERDWYHKEGDIWFISWHFNLKGDRGSHYIGTVSQNTVTGEIIIGRSVCPGNESD